MEKILIVSPFKRDIHLYPHLHDFIALLAERFTVEYLAISERGYFIKELFRPVSLLKVAKIFLGLHKFAGKKNRFQFIIAIDNLPYVLACLFIGGKVILFSHDFVSHDNPWRNAAAQKAIARGTARCLEKNRKIIIQSTARYDLLRKSLGPAKGTPPSPYYLPVSLRKIDPVRRQRPSGIPIVMQIGGINSFRSGSDRILAHYQSNASRYRLFFHGYVSAELALQIRSCEFIPFSSSCITPPGSLHQIVANCDIGFISYEGTDANFYHMAKSSGQLAEFLRMGKPVIATGRNDFSVYLEKERIGIYIKDMNQFNEAIAEIVAHYEDYSSRCSELFEKEFVLNGYMPSLEAWIREDGQWTA